MCAYFILMLGPSIVDGIQFFSTSLVENCCGFYAKHLLDMHGLVPTLSGHGCLSTRHVCVPLIACKSNCCIIRLIKLPEADYC